MTEKNIASQLVTVSASAGSGKTRALALRYLNLLLNPDYKPRIFPEGILAITFTKKAAAEMKERILKYLKAISLGEADPPSRKVLDEIREDVEFELVAARPRAASLLGELFKKDNFFQVQTIDSFINSLIVACALNLNLAAGVRVDKNYEELLMFSLDEVIDLAGSNPEIRKIFEEFINLYLFVEKKSGWYPREEIFKRISRLFEEANRYGQDFSGNIRELDYGKFSGAIMARLAELGPMLGEGINGTFIKSFNNFLGENKLFDFNKNINFLTKEEIPVNKNGRVPLAAGRLWSGIRRQIGYLAEAEARHKFGPYIKIFREIEKHFLQTKSAENLIFLSELNKIAGRIFGPELSVPEIYYRLATRFGHYLIDEFQDTSVLQWHNLRPLIEEALSTGGTLFYVGDKKQSIYRFRGGAATLFDNIPSEFPGHRADPQLLDHNFRSCEEIINFNNKIFSRVNLDRLAAGITAGEEMDLDPELVDEVFHDVRQYPGKDKLKNCGYVQVRFVSFKIKDQRNDLMEKELVPLVRSLLARGCPEVAVLVRENDDVELVSSWLLENKIPIMSDKTLNVRSHPPIKEIISFLKFLNSPVDNLAFASFISGSVFHKSSGLKPAEIQEFIFNQHRFREEKKSPFLYKNFQKAYPQIWKNLMEYFFKNVGHYNLYELVISIFQKFDVSANFFDYQIFFIKFLDLIKKYETEKNDLAGFLEYLNEIPEEELYLKVAASGAVRVLTIHKAKGLQFETVILPFLELAPQVAKEGVIISDESGSLEILHLKNNYLKFSEELAGYYRAEYQRSLIDGLNNLYVAMTRAKSEMYIFVPEKAGSHKNLAWGLLGESPAAYETGRPVNFISEPPADKAVIQVTPASYRNWIEFLKEEFSSPETLINRELITRGEILHFLLSKITLADEKLEPALAAASVAAKARFPGAGDLEDSVATVRKLCHSKTAGRFFSKDAGKVYTELEVVGSNGATSRIDRLIVSEKEILIIDFKSSAEAREEKTAQISRYAEILAPLYPGKKIRGFLVYFDTLAAEEIKFNSKT